MLLARVVECYSDSYYSVSYMCAQEAVKNFHSFHDFCSVSHVYFGFRI